MFNIILSHPDLAVASSNIILSVVTFITAMIALRTKRVKPILHVSIGGLYGLKDQYCFASITTISNGSVYPIQIQDVYFDHAKYGSRRLSVDYDDSRTTRLPFLLLPGDSRSIVHDYSELRDRQNGIFKNAKEVLKLKVVIVTSCGVVTVRNSSVHKWAKDLSEMIFDGSPPLT